MAYNHLEIMDIYNLVSRWHAGYTISQISRTLKLDRKTIRAYIKLAEKIGLSRNHPLPEKTELLTLFQTFLPTNQRGAPVRNLLVPHKDEIVRSAAPEKTHRLCLYRNALVQPFEIFGQTLKPIDFPEA
jgi:hypothetical protein